MLYASIIANLVIISFGSFMGWLSPALPLLLSENTLLRTGRMTNADLSWIGGAVSIGVVIGTFLFAFLSVRFGSKLATTCCAFPCIIFWILIYFGDTFYYSFFARLIGGLTCGGFQSGAVTRKYISEISNDNTRGRLSSIVPLARNLGITITFIGSSYIPYEYRPIIFIFIPIIFLIWVITLPNTPQYYLQGDKFLVSIIFNVLEFNFICVRSHSNQKPNQLSKIQKAEKATKGEKVIKKKPSSIQNTKDSKQMNKN